MTLIDIPGTLRSEIEMNNVNISIILSVYDILVLYLIIYVIPGVEDLGPPCSRG